MLNHKLSYLTHETLPYIWWKHKIQELPQQLLVDDVVEGLRRAVHVETFLAAHEWKPYLRRHFHRMTFHQKSFGRFTVFACLLAFEHLQNPLDRYIKILALASYCALYCHARRLYYPVEMLPLLLQKFIERKMLDLTVDKDFMTRLGNHIIRKGYLRHQQVVDRMMRENRSKQDILRAVAREETIAELASNRDRVAGITKEYIEQHELTNEIIHFLDYMVWMPDPRGLSAKKMNFAQKCDAVSALSDDLKKVSLKLTGVDRLMESAFKNLEDEVHLRKGILEAPAMERIPKKFILNSVLRGKDFL